MDTTQKNFLSAGAIFLMIILSIFLIVNTKKNLETPATTNIISFSGEGKITAKPDVATTRIVVFSEALNSKDAEKANAPKSQAVVDYLKKQGIAEKDIKTTEYQITPQYSFPVPPDNQMHIRNYQAYQELEVKIRNLDKANSIIDGVISAGANKVTDLQFTLDNPEKIKSEARAKAIADAKQKAKELESQLGIHLGKIISFYENSGGYPGPMYLQNKAQDNTPSTGPALPPGENEIQSNVTITYQIK